MSMCILETAARPFPSPPTEIAFHTSHSFLQTQRQKDMQEQTGGWVSAKKEEGQREFLEAKLQTSSTTKCRTVK